MGKQSKYYLFLHKIIITKLLIKFIIRFLKFQYQFFMISYNKLKIMIKIQKIIKKKNKLK